MTLSGGRRDTLFTRLARFTGLARLAFRTLVALRTILARRAALTPVVAFAGARLRVGFR